MKEIIAILFIVLSIHVFGQVSNTKVVRIANATTTFSQPLSEGNLLIDLNTDKTYLILKAIAATASLSTLTANVDYKEYQNGTTDHSTLTNLSYASSGHTGFEPTLTKGNLTETVNGLEFDAPRQVIGGASTLSLSAGYVIPTTTEQSNWTAGYNDKINSLAISGTTTKTITLTQQDAGTVFNTFTDLVDDADASITNEGSLTVGAGTATTSIINSNTSGSTPVTLQAGTNVSLTESGNTITINSSVTGSTPSVGVLYISSAQTITHSVAGTYYTIDKFTSGSANNMTTNASSITIPSTGYYDIRYHISSTHSTNNTIVHGTVFVDGTENFEIQSERKISSAGDYGSYSSGGILYLTAGNIITIRSRSNNTGTVTITTANFSIKRLN